jgi:hypothetical protein
MFTGYKPASFCRFSIAVAVSVSLQKNQLVHIHEIARSTHDLATRKLAISKDQI